MKKEIQVRVDSSEVLNRVSRMFDGTPKSVLRELMQNARRAGATKIDISFLDETLTIAHDGLAFDDFGKLFSLGSSGWDSKGIKNEDPAGMGFFVSTLFESVEVLSRKGKGSEFYLVRASKEQLTKENSKLKVHDVIIKNPKHNVEFRLHKGIEVDQHDYMRVAFHFPVPSTFTSVIEGSKQIISEKYALTIANDGKNNPRLLEKVVNGVRMFFQRVPSLSYTRENPIYFNYHGHEISLYDDVRVLARMAINKGLVLVVLPEENSKIHLTLPARDSIVEDKTYFRMLKDIKDMLAEYVNTQDSHNLSYDNYTKLGGAKKIHQEAAIPAGLKKYWYLGGHNMNILFYDVDEVLAYHLTPYKGYSWYSNYTELSEDNTALRITNGENTSVIVLDDMLEEPPSGLVDSLEVMCLKPDGKLELISSLDQTVLLDEDNEYLSGYFEVYGDRVWICKGTKINSALDYLDECLVSFWEASCEGDADSWDTQMEEFRDTLRAWWEDIFLFEDKERLSIGRAVSKTRWQFNNATLMVIKKDAVYLSGTAGEAVKLSEKDEASIRKIIKNQGD